MENIQNILEQTTTKTNKIKMLLELGMTRKQVAEALGIGYGFVQNVYASVTGGFEVVSPVLKGEDGLSELKKVCDALVNAGAKIRSCCGLHVHLGTSDFKTDIEVWKRLYKNYAALENTIDSFMPKSRRNNTYCESMRVRNWKEKIESAATLQELEQNITRRSRYFKLNSQSYWRHRTVEFRQHSGSVEFEKVKNWILFCARFVEFSKKNAVASEQKTELRKFLNTDLINFYETRAAKFAA